MVTAVTLLVAACGDEGAPVDVLDDPEAVILQVRDEGGFVPPEFDLRRMPRYTLTAGGALFFEGPQIEIYPPPLLPNVQKAQVDDETMEIILQYVADLGFPEVTREENTEATSNVADAPTTVVTYFDGSGEHVFSVYALGIGQFSDVRVVQLAELVQILDQSAYAGFPTAEYVADRIQVWAGPPGAGVDPSFVDVRPWPLPVAQADLPGSGTLAGYRCGTFEGEEAAALLSVFRQATQLTTWDDGGTEHSIIARPLLAGEEGCA